MTRFLTCGTLAACVLGVLGAAGRQQPVFRGGSDAVRVFVTVTDRDGRLVTTLTRDDFEVRDEGKPQPITLFDNTPSPSGSSSCWTSRAAWRATCRCCAPPRSSSSRGFARTTSRASARSGTRSPSARRSHTIPTSSVGAADARLRPMRRRRSGARSTRRWTRSETQSDERRVILVLSDGKDSGPIGFRQRSVSQAEVIDRARRDDVMVYAIGMRSRSTRPMPPGIGPGGLQAMLTADLPDPGLARVAEETGGGYTEIRFGQDLGAAFAGVADELHTQYLLGLRAAQTRRQGTRHQRAGHPRGAEAARPQELRRTEGV